MSGQLHEALAPISWLSGRWVTKNGRGRYPNIADFQFYDKLDFSCVGQPMFNYTSASMHPENGKLMHQERGFLRIKPGTNDLAFVVSHNFGLTSHEEGSCDPEKKEIKLTTVNIARMSFAKPPIVTKIVREIKLVAPKKLQVVLYMETEDKPLNEHLKAVYTKEE